MSASTACRQSTLSSQVSPSMQVYLAIPNDCPYNPDGKKRKLSAEETVSSSVSMFVSDDEGTTFSPVSLPALTASQAEAKSMQ